MASARAAIDHDEIREWVEERGGHPARVKESGDANDPGILRIDYPGFSGQGTLERISWDEFFDAFDENKLAFLFQDESDSRLSKLVDRSSVEVSRGRTRKRTTSRKAPAARKRAASSSKKRGAKAASSRKRSTKTASKKSAKKRTTSSRTSRTSTSRSATTTTNHSEIRKWVESRGGFPAHVRRTGSRKDPGALRIDYPGFSGTRSLERMSWNDCFRWFDRDKLAFLYQNKANSRFSKLVRR